MNLIICASLLLFSPQQQAAPVDKTPATEAPATEAPATEAPATEAPTAESDNENAQKDAAKSAVASGDSAEVAAPEGDDAQDPMLEEIVEEEQAVDLVPAKLNPLAKIENDEAPFIEDVAVAAVNPEIQAMVTAIIVDDKGIDTATLYFRRVDESAFTSMPLSTGSSSLFVGRLPDGLQLGSFEYYIEAIDTGANLTRMGSADEPFLVKAAQEGTLERLERENKKGPVSKIHPAWVMMALGGGVLASAGSGAFFYDYSRLKREIDEIDAKLLETNTEELRARKTEREESAFSSVIIGAVLGALGFVGLTTGISLLVVNGTE